MSKYVNKAWLRLLGAKSKSAIYKYRHQVIRLSHFDGFNDTQIGVNLSLLTMPFIKKNIFNCLSFCIKGCSLHFKINFKSAENYLSMIDRMVNEK